MRGELHVFAVSEYSAVQAVLQALLEPEKPRWQQPSGISLAERDSIVDVIGAVLRSAAEPLSAGELALALAQDMAGTTATDAISEHFVSLLRSASLVGELVIVPEDSLNRKYAHPDSWLGTVESDPSGDAIRTVMRRYLSTYGPASSRQFGYWFGIDPSSAAHWITSLGSEVVSVDVDGTYLWTLREQVTAIQQGGSAHSLRLLPANDPYLAGLQFGAYGFMDPRYRDEVFREDGRTVPVLVVDGEILGTWEYDLANGDLVVTVSPFGETSRWVRSESWVEAVRLAEHFGGDLVFHWRG
jgi:hypothetical protein